MTRMQNDIKALQERALAPHPKPRSRNRFSRAAALARVDMLSRWSGAGLALIAGLSVFMAASAGRAAPTRSAVWVAMMLATLWVSRRLRARFRQGDVSAGRPFRWASDYTASLAVTGVTFATAPLLLAPASIAASPAGQTALLTVLGAFGAGLTTAAHRPSLLALAAPGLGFACVAAFRDGSSLGVLFALSLLAAGTLFAFHRVLQRVIETRNPRTAMRRRPAAAPHEADDEGDHEVDDHSDVPIRSIR